MTQKFTVARVITALTTMGAAALLTAAPADARVPDEPDRNPVVQAAPPTSGPHLETYQVAALGALGGLTLAGATAAGIAARRREGQYQVQY